MDQTRGEKMNADDYQKLRDKLYEDFKKKYPEEYEKYKRLQEKDLEKFFEDNFKKKAKITLED